MKTHWELVWCGPACKNRLSRQLQVAPRHRKKTTLNESLKDNTKSSPRQHKFSWKEIQDKCCPRGKPNCFQSILNKYPKGFCGDDTSVISWQFYVASRNYLAFILSCSQNLTTWSSVTNCEVEPSSPWLNPTHHDVAPP